jgi:hypothetical protein
VRLASLHTALGYVGLTLASSVALADPASDRAMPWGPRPWCAESSYGSFPYCYYSTYQQCWADIWGRRNDSCIPNPYYRGGADAPRTQARRRRHS